MTTGSTSSIRPGTWDFTAEVERSLRVLDGAIGIFCAVGGVEPQSETVWRQADKYGVPRIAFVNKMDRTGADFFRVLEMMRERLASNFVPVQLPVGSGELFNGLLDLVKMKMVVYQEDTLGVVFTESEIPQDLQQQALTYREQLLEAVSDFDDSLMEKFLEGREIAEEEIKAALRKATVHVRAVPVFCGASFKNKGVQRLLDGVVDYLPSPLDVPEVVGVHSSTGKQEARPPSGDAPFAAPGVQGDDRPLRGTADLFSRLFGPPQNRFVCPECKQGQTGAGRGACFECTPTSGKRSGRCLQGILLLWSG